MAVNVTSVPSSYVPPAGSKFIVPASTGLTLVVSVNVDGQGVVISILRLTSISIFEFILIDSQLIKLSS